MASETTHRIYEVVDTTDKLPTNGNRRLIEAPNASQAIRHVASKYKAAIPDTKRIIELTKAGVEVERAGEAVPK